MMNCNVENETTLNLITIGGRQKKKGSGIKMCYYLFAFGYRKEDYAMKVLIRCNDNLSRLFVAFSGN